jgi:sporulation protein YlmC with PRC-barrel domain
MRCQSLWAAALAATMLVAGTQFATAKKQERHKSHPAASAPATQSPSPAAPGTDTPRTPAPSAAPNSATPQTPPSSLPGETAPAPSNNAPPAIVVDKQEVQTILGKSVRDSAGDDMGRVIDVVVDRTGQPLAAIIDFGGFLGVGSRKIAVDWRALQFSPNDPKGNTISLSLTRDQVKAAPEYKDGSPVVILGSSDGLQSMPSTPSTPPAPSAPSAHPQALEK